MSMSPSTSYVMCLRGIPHLNKYSSFSSPKGPKDPIIRYLGVDQNYGPFWGLYYSIFLIAYRGPKGTHNFDQPPLGFRIVVM